MKPTRAPGNSESTPSSMPIPARRIGQTATFFPEIRRAAVASSGVSIIDALVREILRRLVGEQERELVDELPEHLRRRRHVAKQAELVRDERMLDLGDAGRSRAAPRAYVANPVSPA